MIMFSRKTNGCRVPPFKETPISFNKTTSYICTYESNDILHLLDPTMESQLPTPQKHLSVKPKKAIFGRFIHQNPPPCLKNLCLVSLYIDLNYWIIIWIVSLNCIIIGLSLLNCIIIVSLFTVYHIKAKGIHLYFKRPKKRPFEGIHGTKGFSQNLPPYEWLMFIGIISFLANILGGSGGFKYVLCYPYLGKMNPI